MSLFKNLTTEGLEENQDRVGGFSVLETDVYAGKIKMAFAGQSAKGAHFVTLIADLGSREYRETFYITNQKGENFWLSKNEKDDKGNPKRIALPGFTHIDDICQVATGKVLAEQESEEKMVNIYDPDLKKEVPKAVPVLTELLGKDILVAVQKTIVDKTKKDGDEYVATGESKEENTIEKVFHPELRVTVVEAKEAAKSDKQPVAGFIDVWAERNKGKTKDKRQNKGNAGQAGRPAGSNSGPPQGSNSGARKSLFGANATA